MRRLAIAISVCSLLGLSGCASDDWSRDWFGDSDSSRRSQFDPKKAPAASTQTATRAAAIGSEVVAANKDLKLTVMFTTVGIPEPLITHDGDHHIIISEGLIQKCKSDAELAGVISYEIAKITSKREDSEPSRLSNRELPPSPRLTSDITGRDVTPDMTRVAEEAYFQKNRRSEGNSRDNRPVKQVDYRERGRDVFMKAGYKVEELSRIDDLMKEAEQNADRRDLLRQ